MMQHRVDYDPKHNPHKTHRGLMRFWYAAWHTCCGLMFALREESAFRQECALAVLLLPWVYLLDFSVIEQLLLILTIGLILVAELFNSAIEAAIDRISFEAHSLSKRAKDYGSAAVFLCLILWAITWGTLVLPKIIFYVEHWL